MTNPELLAAIIANKSDDVPRLIYADWLEEHGESERAEFIRVQCELPNCERPLYGDHGGYPSQYLILRKREEWLMYHQGDRLDMNWTRWTPFGVSFNLNYPPPTTSGTPNCTFTRGFVSAITCSWQDWLAHADAILKATPLERVRLTTYPFQQEAVVPGRTRDELEAAILNRQWPGIEFELPGTFERDVMVRHIASQFGVPPHLINLPILHNPAE